MAYNYITDRGVIVPDTADVLEEVQNEWREAFGSDLSLEPETPQGMIIAMEARSRAEAARAMAAFANQQMHPEIAQGIFLDALWAAFGGSRRAATRSTLSGVVFSGVPGTIINAGSIAQTGAGARFRTVSTLIIGQSGSVVGDMEAVETGPIEAAPGSLNQVATTVLGWEQVHNPSAATLGREQETDVQARRRRRNTLALQSISVNEAIISRVYSLEGVKSLSYRENLSSDPQVIDGIAMIPNSVYLCIDGGDDAQIAEALKATKTLGAGYNGAVEVTIVDSISGQNYTVKFDRPDEINLFVRVTVRASTLNAQSIIPDALMEANAGNIEGADPLAVGVDVSPFEFSAAINFVEPRLVVLGVEFSSDGATWQSTPWPVALNQVVRIQRSAIQVVVV